MTYVLRIIMLLQIIVVAFTINVLLEIRNSFLDLEELMKIESYEEVKPLPISKYEIVYSNIIGTVYHPTKEQTDNTPFITATNDNFEHLDINNIRWCALSRDLIDREYTHDNIKYKWNGKIKLNDTIYVSSKCDEINGWWVVKDVMNKRYTNRIDFLQDPTNSGLLSISCPDINILKKL